MDACPNRYDASYHHKLDHRSILKNLLWDSHWKTVDSTKKNAENRYELTKLIFNIISAYPRKCPTLPAKINLKQL